MPRTGTNIHKRVDGRWEGRYCVIDVETGDKRYKSIYGKTYQQVKDKLLEAKINQREIEASTQYSLKELKISQIASEWLYDVCKKRKYSTYIKYKTLYQNHIAPYIGNEVINNLNHEFIKDIISKQENVSICLERSLYCVCNQLIAYANREYHMNLTRVYSENPTNNSRMVTVLSHSEQQRLMEVLWEDIDAKKMGIILCLSTGLRLGEICALKWSDIDFDDRILYVNRTVQRITVENQKNKTMLLEGEPKSISSKRMIPLTNEIVDLLSQFRSNYEYVISKSKPMDPRTYQNTFQKYLSMAQIQKCNFHILRHTFATNCIDAGIDVKSLSEILGHSDVKISLNRYVHPSIETKRNYLSNLSTIYGQTNGHAFTNTSE